MPDSFRHPLSGLALASRWTPELVRGDGGIVKFYSVREIWTRRLMPRSLFAGRDHVIEQDHAIPCLAPVARGVLLDLPQKQAEFLLSIVDGDRRHDRSPGQSGAKNEPKAGQVQGAGEVEAMTCGAGLPGIRRDGASFDVVRSLRHHGEQID